MNGFLLDTNIPSELVRPQPEPKVTRNTKDFDGLGVALLNPWLEQ
jgi:predicted nucleic acid-binding protein